MCNDTADSGTLAQADMHCSTPDYNALGNPSGARYPSSTISAHSYFYVYCVCFFTDSKNAYHKIL